MESQNITWQVITNINSDTSDLATVQQAMQEQDITPDSSPVSLACTALKAWLCVTHMLPMCRNSLIFL